MTRKFLAVLFVALTHAAAYAQSWPAKPIHAVVPVGAGSSTDIVHRLVLQHLSAELGQPIVVENRTGAGGTIGSAVVAKAQPDGYTLLANGSAHTIAPALYKALPYDAVCATSFPSCRSACRPASSSSRRPRKSKRRRHWSRQARPVPER